MDALSEEGKDHDGQHLVHSLLVLYVLVLLSPEEEDADEDVLDFLLLEEGVLLARALDVLLDQVPHVLVLEVALPWIVLRRSQWVEEPRIQVLALGDLELLGFAVELLALLPDGLYPLHMIVLLGYHPQEQAPQERARA